MTLGAGCHVYRAADSTRPRVEPVRVTFATPQTVTLRRQSADSLLAGVSRIDGILVWSDPDSIRVGVTGAQTSNGWRAVQAPSDAMIPVRPGVVVEHHVLSRTRTAGLIALVWAGTVALVAAALH